MENPINCVFNVASVDRRESIFNLKQQAVTVRNAFKHYGRKRNTNPILNDFNMTVTRGTIYGLLGASGCGKTTLLSCLVGNRKLNSGDICVLGGTPGTKGSGIPGKAVGYMPQEIALYGDFSIKEIIMYFGWIFEMKTNEILERLQFLLNLLDLPSQNDYIQNLSGGQQRRVSFAVALLHDPELLILDEPTVGVDPLLRQNIWDHLVHLTKVNQKTVLLTTHYIEEASRGHKIGLMRSGRLLAEESPQKLMAMYQCNNLEDVFLNLIMEQGTSNEASKLKTSELSASELDFGNKTDLSVYKSDENGIVGLNYHKCKEVMMTDKNNSSYGRSLNSSTAELAPGLMGIHFDNLQEDKRIRTKVTSIGKIRALLSKNFLRMSRNLSALLFIFALPVIQSILFCLAIGREPKDLKLAIVNNDVNGTECHFDPGCNFDGMSCRYLSHLNESILQEHYHDTESAIEAVRDGKVWGAVYFNENFTSTWFTRMLLGHDADNETLQQSEIRVWMDMSNQQISTQLCRSLEVTYGKFVNTILKDCDKNPRIGELPIQFKEPIYGTNTPSFTDFIAPGCMTTIVFFLATALTSSILITERTDGLQDRSIVAGVNPGEILFCHVFTQFFIMFGQTALMLLVILLLFNVTCNGSIFLIVLITLLQGMCGMSFGFVISAICELERDAMQLSLGSFYPIMLLSGVVWPIEGNPMILRYIAYYLPMTQALTAIRCILARGWGIHEPEVYLGFISTFSWIILFMGITIVVFKWKRG